MPTLAEHLAAQRCPICDAPFDDGGRYMCDEHSGHDVLAIVRNRARALVASATTNGVRIVPGHMLPAFEDLVRALGYRACENDEQRRET